MNEFYFNVPSPIIMPMWGHLRETPPNPWIPSFTGMTFRVVEGAMSAGMDDKITDALARRRLASLVQRLAGMKE